MRARFGRRPSGPAQTVLESDTHQLVVGGGVLDLVDAHPVTVVGAQDGRVLIGEPAPQLGLLAACQRAEPPHLLLRPARTFPVQAFDQGGGRRAWFRTSWVAGMEGLRWSGYGGFG